MERHVSILVPKGNVIADTIMGSYNLLQMASNHFRKTAGKDAMKFKIDLVGITNEVHQYNMFFGVTPTKTLKEVVKTDLIIIPGLVGNMREQIDLNQDMVSWMKQQRIQNNAEIASLCRGAFLLAETGLMNGRSCATHWITHDTFRAMYPKVNLLPEKVISEDNGIYSSGGAYSFLNLLLYLIEKNFGRETAIWCSKTSEVDFDRIDQMQFVIFKGQKGHADAEVLHAQEHIEKEFHNKISVEALAQEANTSSRNFIRRFKKATHNTPIEYIQRVRVEAAKRLLETTTLQVHQVMYDCGYSDSKAFRTIFKRHAGLTPLEYRNKYNREAAYV